MKSTKIVTAPHPSLRQVAQPIQEIDKKILEFISVLSATLTATRNPPGVGLASPQINKNWRIFATQLENSQSDTAVLKTYINPKIIDQADKLVTGINPREPDLEGCLSIPLLYGPVARPEWVTLEYQTIENNELSHWHTETYFDFTARVIQHELDHLNGILFTDHILQQNQPLFQQENEKLIEIDPQIAAAL